MSNNAYGFLKLLKESKFPSCGFFTLMRHKLIEYSLILQYSVLMPWLLIQKLNYVVSAPATGAVCGVRATKIARYLLGIRISGFVIDFGPPGVIFPTPINKWLSVAEQSTEVNYEAMIL